MHSLDFDTPGLLPRLEHEVHVWMARPEAVACQDCLSLLSTEEQARYHRFYFDNDRHHYRVAHALLRRALSAYVDVDPAEWRFSSNQHGRPEIAGPAIKPALRFNLSHTNGLVACVVALELDCGIDVEQVTARGDPLAIAGKMFAPVEQQRLAGLTGDAMLEKFFSYWTLREAYCKALGVGIAYSRKDYCFVEEGSNQWVVRFDASADDRGQDWQLALDRPISCRVLALAIRTAGAPVRNIIQGFVTP